MNAFAAKCTEYTIEYLKPHKNLELEIPTRNTEAIWYSLFPGISHIQNDGHKHADAEKCHRKNINEVITKGKTDRFLKHIANEACRDIQLAKMFFNFPMPIGDKAITPTEPIAQTKPRQEYQKQGEAVCFARFFKNPP